MKRQHEQRIFTVTWRSYECFRYGITCHVTFQSLQKQFQCKPHCAINSSQCSLDPSQHVYCVKRQHEQRTFTKTRSWCEHFRYGITCHLTFQFVQKHFQCKPHCTVNSSQCLLVPSQHFYCVKGQHQQRTFTMSWRSYERFRYGITCHVTFQLLQKQFQCKPHCAINSSQCSLDPSQHVYCVKRQHEQRTFTKTRRWCEHFRYGIT